jgi:hypothetical protein
MSVKTGSAWAGSFVTLDSTGALSASADAAGVLYVDGVANAATVTITGSNPYKWSVTLPSLTAGQRVDMYITGTIATIATAGFVASEQADTSILSDGVVVNSGTVTNLTNLPAIPDNWLTGTGVDASAVTKLQANLALEATLTAIKGAGWDTQTLAAIDVLIDAIKAKTDTITAAPTVDAIADGVWDEAIAAHTTATTFGGKNQKVVPSETINDYKADVSALTNVKLAADQSGVTIPAVTTVTNLTNAPTNGDLTATMKSSITTAASSATPALSAAGVDAILDEVVVGSYTMRQLMKVLAAGLAGKLSGGGTTTLTFRGVDDTSNVIVATVDASHNRTDVVLTV